MTYDHVMIDIETMSLHPHNALILSVGMIEFDPTSTIYGLKIGAKKLIVPDLAEQILMGRHVDPATQKWWAEQSDEACEHWLEACEHWTADSTVEDIRDFCASAKYIWANGTQFDLSNLIELAAQVRARATSPHVGPLWSYRAPRDMRTFCNETSATRLLLPDAKATGVPHEPIYDCVTQAYQVWSHWQS